MLSRGTQIGRYTVDEAVAANDHAEVYRGIDNRFDRRVALKLMMGTSERDHREAQAAASLNHPNVVRTLDAFEHDGQFCLVREWIEGDSLETVLAVRDSLGLEETLRVAHDVASALDYAHGRGVLHRDIKPSNVLRSADGSYKLVDFGVAGRLEGTTGTTVTGQIAGTPLYMSPEQLQGTPQTPASDLFGLGLLLFRCLHGRLPGENADSLLDLMRSRLSAAIPVPSSPLQGVISSCLQLDPSRRPRSAEQVLELLRGIAEPPHPAASVDVTSDAPMEPDYSYAAAPPELPAVGIPAAYRGLRRAPMWIAVAAALVVTALVLGRIDPGALESLARVALGILTAAAAVLLSRLLRRRWSSRSPDTERQAAQIIFGADSRADLTRSLTIEVDQLVTTLHTLDKKILGMTVLAMVREYETSKESSDRQTALLNVVTLMEKVQAHLAPWHVRHREAIASTVAVVGCLTGIVSAVSPFVT